MRFVCLRRASVLNERRASSGLAAVCVVVLAACQPAPSPTPSEPIPPADLPLIVGVEYALPGLGDAFADLHLPGVKFLPDAFKWGTMQPAADAPIDFSMLDRQVKEYQDAGFTDCMVGLKSESPWASIAPSEPLPDTNPAPKPEHLNKYAVWVGAIVERYDGDGIDDMPGLRRAVRYLEIGVEFSSYEPEPVADYLAMLETAYRAAHAAFPAVQVLHAAFLTTTAFKDDPEPAGYAAAFAAVDPRIMYHSIEDIRAVLDRPELFDAVNVHLLGAADETEPTVRWINYEMGQRGYVKPVIISDTSPSPLAGWGPATVCDQPVANEAVLIPPATEQDRCRLADFFTRLIAEEEGVVNWTRAYVAVDMSKKVIVAADQGIAFINTSFMEDFLLFQSALFQAGAGVGAWGGMARTTFNAITQTRSVQSLYPVFHALQQVVRWLNGYTTVHRTATDDPNVHLYQLEHTGDEQLPDSWIAWYEPEQLVLYGDPVPHAPFRFPTSAPLVRTEKLVTNADGLAEVQTLTPTEGIAEISLTGAPLLIQPSS